MPFIAPEYIPQLPSEPPEDIPIHDFLFKDRVKYGGYPQEKSLTPYVCGLTGRAFTTEEYVDRYESLARALAAELDMEVNKGDEMSKAVGTFSLNTVDTLAASWAVQRLNGVSCQISPAYQTPELTRQLEKVKLQALFTCVPLLDIALEAAKITGLPRKRIYLLDVPEKTMQGQEPPADLKTVESLVQRGKKLPALEAMNWSAGQGARQTAYLCSSSGTSGMPKNVQISHLNVICNVMQSEAFDRGHKGTDPDTALGILPLSHSYGLITTGHLSPFRGDRLVILPSFDLVDCLTVMEDYEVARTWTVPPMIVAMVKAAAITKQYDLSKLRHLVTGALPITEKMIADFKQLVPNCDVVRVYGATEAAVVISFGHPEDVMPGSVGHVLPGHEMRVVTLDGEEVEEHNKTGQLHIRGKTIMQGYLDNEDATKETVDEEGWLRTGDLAEIRVSPKGNEHIFIVDRVKEMIKVRGLQVAPTELETYLIRHKYVQDVAIVPIPNDTAGELPLAFIIKSEEARATDEKVVKESIFNAVADNFAEYKRLTGGIEFLDSLPKSASGKTLRGVMKEKAKALQQETHARAPAVVQSFEFSDSEDDDDD